MKIYNYVTTVVGMLGAFPGYSTGLSLPPRQLSEDVESPYLAGPQATTMKRDPGCISADHIYGCRLPPPAPRHSCSEDLAFFETTDANWQASAAGTAYVAWTMSIDFTSASWTERASEPSFFAEQVLGWQDFDCGRSYHGCRNVPSCDDIWTTMGDKDKARQIHFIITSMQNMVFANGVVAVGYI